jgi:lycopene beta-cyclase
LRAGDLAENIAVPEQSGPRWIKTSDLPHPGASGVYDYVILGAGCAGLSLCHALLRRGVTGDILILDRKLEFLDDRTWCFWEVEPTPFSHLASKRWYSWKVRAGDRETVQSSGSYPYLCLSGADFYEAALEYISRHPNVSLGLGEEAEIVCGDSGVPRVSTSGGSYEGRAVLDCRGLPPGSPLFEKAREEANWVPQKFVGVRVRAARPVFDASRCTLMDFSVSQKRGLRFAYLLPFSAEEALVENVYLSEADATPQEIRTEALEYLREEYGIGVEEYRVLKEESGYIPMTDYRFPRERATSVYNVGMVGGETRPSTGYTFLRIQRYCDRLAESLVRGGGPPERGEARRYDVLDGLFLRLMRESPESCPELYLRMFERVPPDSMVRFLTERSSPLDEARLIRALPKMPFLSLAGRAFSERLSRRIRS